MSCLELHTLGLELHTLGDCSGTWPNHRGRSGSLRHTHAQSTMLLTKTHSTRALAASSRTSRARTALARSQQRAMPLARPRAVPLSSSAVVLEQQQQQQQQASEQPQVSGVAASDASHAVIEEATHGEAQTPFQWRQHWWPVAPLDTLDKQRPTPFTLLGVDVVVWWSDADRRWQVFRDICPHRLAPLSQGRLSKDGSLVCSYHGWKFNTAGACTQITQLDAAAQAKVCGTARTCVTSFPTLEEDSLLFAWMDPSPQGLELSKLKGVPKAPVNPNKPKGGKTVWVANLVPNDLSFWLEQSQDPSHANWLHAGLAFKSEDAVPMAHTRAPRVDLATGFDYEHGGYEKRNAAMRATRHFIPPFTTIGLYRMPFGTQLLNTRFVPVRPGWVRTFASFDFLPPGADTTVLRDTRTGDAIPPPPAPPPPPPGAAHQQPPAKAKAKQPPAWLRSLNPLSWLFARVSSGAIPHWVVNANTLGDQDVVIQHEMEVLQARNQLDHTHYVMPAVGADVGVAAMHRWLRLARYPEAVYGAGAKRGGHEELLPLERLLDRGERHVRHCVQCQQGLALTTRIFWALAGAAFVSASFGLGLLAAASVGAASWQTTGAPLAALLVGGAALAKLAQAAWEFREERFISGVRSWKRAGGLSLVKMPA